MSTPIELWRKSARAWIATQGEHGDDSRRLILDPAMADVLGPPEGLDILDVGCGEGRYVRLLRAQGARAVGIDPVEELIAHAKSRDPESGYLVASGEQLPFEDASFDVVVSYLSLIDIPDDLAALAEMARAVRPGGRIIIATISNMASTSDRWVRDDAGRALYRTVDRYMEPHAIRVGWSGIDIVNFHRPLSETLSVLLRRDLVLTHFIEPLPPKDSPLYEDEYRVPTFQIYALAKVERAARR